MLSSFNRFFTSVYTFLVLCPLIIIAAIISSFYGTEITAGVFTSPFFYPVYALLALNFIFCGIKRLASARRSTAFVLIHIGTLIVIGGASAGHFSQTKGFMTLYQQSSDDRIFAQDSEGNVGTAETLPFTLYLDRFWIQYYEPEENAGFYVEAYPDDASPGDDERHLVMFVGEGSEREGEICGFNVHVEEILPHAEVLEKEITAPQLVVELDEDGSRLSFPVKVGEPIRAEQAGATFTPIKIYRTARVSMDGGGISESSGTPLNPALVVEVEDKSGSGPELRYLFAKMPDFHSKKDESAKYSLFYRPPETSVSVSPAEDNEGPLAVKISASGNNKSASLWYFPGHERLHDFRSPVDGLIVGVSVPEPKIKDFKSKVTVVEDGEITASKVIEVNHPLAHNGYMFFQNSYDKGGNRYTVLEVVRDPGVWWVMAGFLLIMLGVIQKFYLDTLFTTARKKAQPEGGVR